MKECLDGSGTCICAVSLREGNNIYGVYACDPGLPPMAIRYLVDPSSPAETVLSPAGDKYTVRSRTFILHHFTI